MFASFVLKESCINILPDAVQWYNRVGNEEDPWIGYLNHPDGILYGLVEAP